MREAWDVLDVVRAGPQATLTPATREDDMVTRMEHTPVALGRQILIVLIALLATARSGAAQDTAASATMLRIIGEAADQFRTGRPVWLVADYRFPHRVKGPFATRDAARLAARDPSAALGVFGPYVTARDSSADSGSRIVSVRVVLRAAGGTETTVDVNPAEVDALFFTMAPFDKFVIPYYSRLYGPEFALRLRDYAMLTIRRPKGHCTSVTCEPDDHGRWRVFPLFDPREWPRLRSADSVSH